MSLRDNLQQVLRVAPPKGMQHATNKGDTATGIATENATTPMQASNDAGHDATSHATTMQQHPENHATTVQQKAALASLVSSVLRRIADESNDPISDAEVEQAIQIALADYDDALVCFTNLALVDNFTTAQ